MKSVPLVKSGLFVLAVAVLGLVLGGCSSSCGDCCPSVKGRCCGWDFYKPCDMIEGRAERQARSMGCGQPCPCAPGVVYEGTQYVPATAPAKGAGSGRAVSGQAVSGQAPAAPMGAKSGEGNAPVADFGPPAGR